MSKGTDQFTQVIQKHLDGLAETDSVFAEKLKDKNKSIDSCISYILERVQKSGKQGFTDPEIFGMAVHYYDEKGIKAPKNKPNAKVVINHSVELTESEKAQVRKQAMDSAMKEEKEKILKDGLPSVELTAEEKESAKQKALDQLVEEERLRMANKQPKKKAANDPDKKPEVVQNSLF